LNKTKVVHRLKIISVIEYEVSLSTIKSKPLRRYTWGGAGTAERGDSGRSGISFASFLFSRKEEDKL